MASMTEPLIRNALVDHNTHYSSSLLTKSMPIVAVPVALNHSTASAMDNGPSSGASMAPPVRNSPNSDSLQDGATPTPQEQNNPHQAANGLSNAPVGAAAAAQQPKVVQTAFIHKLYSMLEDHSIQHLISWSTNNESFVMSPSSEFSKVLAQYFKHTNISSFVRQLNMYGFHKVSDVFHTAAPDSPLWEFKHGAGNFKRGDLVGLREIKRRASRHALIHRDSFSAAPKMPAPVPTGGPIETPHLNYEPPDSHVQALDWALNHRLARAEEAHHAMVARYQVLMEGLVRCHHWNHELSSHLLALVPDPDNPIHRDVFAMRQDIARHAEALRNMNESHEPSFVGKQPFFAQNSMAAAMEPSMPVSPRQRPFDESRRSSLQATGKLTPFHAASSSHLQVSPRRFGSIGAGNGLHSPLSRPGYLPPRPPPPPPQPQQPQHAPAPSSTSPLSLVRRHTSADIRVHGWQGGQSAQQHGSSPYASGQSSSAWPSSPRATMHTGDQQLRDALSQYELPRASGVSTTNQSMGNSRQPSPPPYDSGGGRDSVNNSGGHNNNRSGSTGPPSFNNVFGGNNNNNSAGPSYANPNDAGWQLPGPRFSFKGIDTPDSQTRRGSMASNVHSLLNPADTAERGGGDDGPEERKRKRLL